MSVEMNLTKLRALADPTRLHIVEFLSRNCCGSASVRDDGAVEGPTAGEVCCHITGLDKINSTISHHLHELESARLVRLEKRGKSTLCSLRSDELQSLAAYLTQISEGIDDDCSCCRS